MPRMFASYRSLTAAFLAGSAGLALVPAQAADLPAAKAAPVEYVRVCSEFGRGFFYIPGTDTCLQVGGRVRAEYRYEEPFQRSDNTMRMRARGYLNFDTYTRTDYGPVRATTRFYITKDTGSSPSVTLDWAYIQWLGFTAGRLEFSFFDFSPIGEWGYLDATVLGRGAYHQSTNAFAYTAKFGGEFMATIAIESPVDRQVGYYTYTPYSTGFPGFNPVQVEYGGTTAPDVIGRLEWDPSWGQAVLAGAIHQNRLGGPFGAGFNGLTGPGGTVIDTRLGYAVNIGVKIDLPMLAKGDAFMASAVYGYGATDYTGWTTAGSAGTFNNLLRSDGLMSPGTTDLSLSHSYSLSAGLKHYWSDWWSQAIFAAYGGLNQQGSDFDVRAFTIGTNVVWSPSRWGQIGAEVYYSRLIDVPRGDYAYNSATNSFVTAGTSPDNWGGRLRFQRSF